MTTPTEAPRQALPADLEALMPRHDIRVDAFGEITASDRRPFVMGEFFTADQVREAMLAATERAQDDTRRLDWIVRQADEFSCSMIVDAPGDGEYIVHGMDGWGQGVTPREAIDAAMRFSSGGEAGS